jgi:hypothetical protein
MLVRPSRGALVVVLLALCGAQPAAAAFTSHVRSSGSAGHAASVFRPRAVAPPVISGAGVVGRVLTVSDGTWARQPVAFDVQWSRCQATCSAIDGATGREYRPVSADAGHTLRAEITARNSGGAASSSTTTDDVVREPSYRDVVLDDGPRAYWRFEQAGPTVPDETGNGHTLTVRGDAASGQPGGVGGSNAGRVGGEGRFDRAGAIDPRGGITLEAWATPSALPLNGSVLNSGGASMLVAKGNEAPGSCFRGLLERVAWTDYGTQVCTAQVGRRNHLAMVTGGGSGTALYVDGTLVATLAAQPAANARWNTISLGQIPSNDLGFVNEFDPDLRRFRGTIDEAAIYPTRLSAARIRAHAEAGR